MKKFNLSQHQVDALTELCKEENVIWEDSYYLGKRFGFKLTDIWIEKYGNLLKQQTVVNNYLDFIIGIISRCYFIDTEMINKIGLDKNYIKMIRRSYYFYDEELNVIFLANKRPFGNSNIIGDVIKEFEIPTIDENGIEIEINWESEYSDLLDDIIIKIKDFFINCKFSTDIEGYCEDNIISNTFYFYYSPTKKYIRNCKINLIFK